jgi:hypothetical protein
MRPDEILKLQRERPFTGLRIYISDGSSYDVRHPEMMLVTIHKVYIALPPSRENAPPGGAVHCDPVHITRIEPLNGKRRANGKSRRT